MSDSMISMFSYHIMLFYKFLPPHNISFRMQSMWQISHMFWCQKYIGLTLSTLIDPLWWQDNTVQGSLLPHKLLFSHQNLPCAFPHKNYIMAHVKMKQGNPLRVVNLDLHYISSSMMSLYR